MVDGGVSSSPDAAAAVVVAMREEQRRQGHSAMPGGLSGALLAQQQHQRHQQHQQQHQQQRAAASKAVVTTHLGSAGHAVGPTSSGGLLNTMGSDCSGGASFLHGGHVDGSVGSVGSSNVSSNGTIAHGVGGGARYSAMNWPRGDVGEYYPSYQFPSHGGVDPMMGRAVEGPVAGASSSSDTWSLSSNGMSPSNAMNAVNAGRRGPVSSQNTYSGTAVLPMGGYNPGLYPHGGELQYGVGYRVGGMAMAPHRQQYQQNHQQNQHHQQKGSGPRLFCGHVPKDVTEDMVRLHFSQWGLVTDVYFPRHKKTLKRRPFCFVTFSNLECAKIALRESPLNICGIPIKNLTMVEDRDKYYHEKHAMTRQTLISALQSSPLVAGSNLSKEQVDNVAALLAMDGASVESVLASLGAHSGLAPSASVSGLQPHPPFGAFGGAPSDSHHSSNDIALQQHGHAQRNSSIMQHFQEPLPFSGSTVSDWRSAPSSGRNSIELPRFSRSSVSGTPGSSSFDLTQSLLQDSLHQPGVDPRMYQMNSAPGGVHEVADPLTLLTDSMNTLAVSSDASLQNYDLDRPS